MSTAGDNEAAATAAIDSLFNAASLLPRPSPLDGITDRAALKCYLLALHATDFVYPRGCKRGVKYLAENGYISGGPEEGGTDPYGLTDKLVLLTAHFDDTGDQVNWDALAEEIDSASDDFAPGHSGATLRAATTRLVGHWRLRQVPPHAGPGPRPHPPLGQRQVGRDRRPGHLGG